MNSFKLHIFIKVIITGHVAIYISTNNSSVKGVIRAKEQGGGITSAQSIYKIMLWSNDDFVEIKKGSEYCPF